MRKHQAHPFAAKAVSAALTAALLLAPAQSIAYAADAGSTQPQEQQISAFQFKYPAEHTFAEINQFYAEHPYDISLPDKYDIRPDISNEEINTRIGTDTSALLDAKGKAYRDTLAGSLSQETLDNALNATNFMRYSAGLQLLYIHTNDRIGGYQWRAQAGAALMAELNTITHNVDGNEALAAGVVSGVFGWAKAGPGGSNIVAGSGVANKMVNSFMPDIGNDRTGLSHRSYILNPGLSGTGFGAADLSGTKNPKTGKARGSAVSMMVTYYGADPDGLSAVLWPSRRQPIETFQARGTWQMSYPEGNPYQGNPWSYFINTDSAKVDTSTLKVTLECDGKPTDVLDFNDLTAAEKSENRLFTIGSSPLKRLIAFRPHVAYGAGDKVKVTIEGIVDEHDLPIPVSYDVHFFQTGTEPHPNLEQTSVSRTAADTAEFEYTSDYAGTMYYLVQDADQPEPSADAVLGGTKLALGTDEALLALTGLTGNSAKKLYYITASSTAAGKDHTTAGKSGEMSAVKSINIEEYIAPSMVLTDTAAVRESKSTGTVSFTAPVAGTYHYIVRDASDLSCDHTAVLAGTEAVMTVGENQIALTGLTDNAAKSVFLYAQGTDSSNSAVTRIELLAYQPAAPSVTAPTANTLTYNGTAQPLITAGSTSGGRMEYRLGDTGDYSTDVPMATNAGTYTVWYKVVGDDTHDSVAEQSLSVCIAKAKVTATAKSYAIQTGDKAPDLTAPVLGTHYTVDGLFGADALYGTAVLTYKKNGAAVTPDTSAAGTYDIVLSGVTAPAGGNYEPLVLKNGTLTITVRSSSGGGAGGGGGSSAGGGGGGGATESTYPVASSPAKNGSVSLNTHGAAKGSTVTITVKPDSGYKLDKLTVTDQNGNRLSLNDQGNGKYTFIMPTGKVSVESVFAPITAQPEFKDVANDSYYYDAVQWAVEKGITEGTGTETFSPHASCTRAQTVTFLWRAAGAPEPKNSVNPFSDLDPSAYYYKAVLWALENGITQGTSADTFSPGATVDRGQTVTFLHRAAGSPLAGSSDFNDVSDGAYYAKAVAWANENGITSGTGNGKFTPNADCTRGQIVTLLYRANN